MPSAFSNASLTKTVKTIVSIKITDEIGPDLYGPQMI
jgi:hypothetical protein